jgi:hypothetical protein
MNSAPFAVHTARATNEMLYKFLNRPVFTASKCRFLFQTACFLHCKHLQSANRVLGSITICSTKRVRAPQALRNDRVSATIGSVREKDFVANRQRLSKSWRLPDFADLRLQS